jgi:tetratricopeptide (TPR) repeat protein
MRAKGLRLLASLAILAATLAGCSTTPPAPVPAARRQTERQASEAARLSQAENWPAAVEAWQAAADRFALLNDRAGEAMAWHNLGQARREIGMTNLARQAFEQAAQINRQLGRTNAWWRNQIALAQMEIGDTNAAAARFKSLSAQPPPAGLEGYYLNELGRYQTETGDFAAAARSFDQVKASFEKEQNAACLAAVSMNRALLLDRQKQYPAALVEWRHARAACEALADPAGLARALLGEGQTLFESNQDLPQAEGLLRQAARNYATLRHQVGQKRALTLLIECLRAQNKPVEAEQARLAGVEKN